MTGNSGSDFRIKLLVVHPDGRRQKFLVTFPERRTLKIDQRYIGLPLTLRVDFVPGAIVCRPGTGHNLTIAGKAVKEHSLNLNDVIGLDQYSIEFLELPEPLPLEEATRFVSIDQLNDMAESTVVVSPPMDQDLTPPPPVPQRTPAPKQPAQPEEERRPDPEDSTAIIRRLQVPGALPGSTTNYASLKPTGRQTETGIPHGESADPQYSNFTATGTSTDFSESFTARTGIRFNKRHAAIAGGVLAAFVGLLILGKSDDGAPPETSKTELASSSEESAGSLATDTSMDDLADGEMKPMDIPEPEALAAAPAPTEPVVPAPQSMVPPAVPMSAGPVDSPFDDKSGFDPMAVDQFFDAVEAGDEGRIKDILDKRLVDVNLSRRRGYAALHLAAARGDLATVKYLIQVKADPNVLDGSGATPVMWAVFRRHESVVRFLAPKTNLKIERQGGETAHALAQRLKMKPNIVRALDPEPKKNTAGKNAPRKRVPTSLPEKKKK